MPEIKEITMADFGAMMDSAVHVFFDVQYRPLGLFYIITDDGYIGIDNSTGHAWTEEFSSKEKCERWLNGEEEVSSE